MGQRTGGWLGLYTLVDAWSEFTWTPERHAKKLAKAKMNAKRAWRNADEKRCLKWERRVEELESRYP